MKIRGILILVSKKLLFFLPDRAYLKIAYWLRMGKKLNLDNPLTFNEKLQWLKLYDRRPEYTALCDKYTVKEIVEKIIGRDYIIPTLAVWDNPEDICIDELPCKFVLKCTHDSGSVIICRDKSKLNVNEVKHKMKKWIKRNYYKNGREWPYKNVTPRIIAEEYIEPQDGTNDLPDYKFFCFNGEVKALFIATGRQAPNEEVKFDFFDADFNHLPIRQGHDHANNTPQKPENFELMKDLSAKLSKGIPHVRVDFYEVNGRVLFGEMTFSHYSGFVPFEPMEWDYYWGDMIKLPRKMTE